MYFSIARSMSIILFILCLFPYISFIDTPFDTQPYALIFSVFIIIFSIFNRNFNIPLLLVPFIIVVSYAFLLLLFDYSFSGLRSLVGYASILLISMAGYLSFGKIQTKYFIIAVYVWLFVGIIQFFFYKEFGSFLTSRLSTSDTRGVTSLAVEPSHYSILCIFFLILNDIFLARGDYSIKIYNIIFILILIQLAFASSGLGFVLFFIYLISKMISQKELWKLFNWLIFITFSAIILINSFLYLEQLQSTRLGKLINLFTNNPLELFFSDGSASDRIGHIIVSIGSLPYNYGIGFGLGTWIEDGPRVISEMGGLALQLSNYYMTFGNRIMSGWGTAIFELGIIGVLLIVAFIFIMMRGALKLKGNMKKVYLSSGITIFFIMLNAIPLALPILGYSIGIFVFLQLEEKLINNNL